MKEEMDSHYGGALRVSVIYYQLIIYNRLHQNAWPTPGPGIFVNISDGSRLHRENFKSNNE